MTPENFVYWLQGYLELSEDRDISSTQVQIIKDHVALVLRKQTPSRYVETGSVLMNNTQLSDFVKFDDHTFCHVDGIMNYRWDYKNKKWITVSSFEKVDNFLVYNQETMLSYPDGPPASC